MHTAGTGTGTGRTKVLLEDVAQQPRADGFISKPANEANENTLTSAGGFPALFFKETPALHSCRECRLGWDRCLSISREWQKMLKCYLNTSLPERWDPTWSWRSIHTSADLETYGPAIQMGVGERNGVTGRQMVWQMEQLKWINNRTLSRSKSLAHSAHILPTSRWNKPWEQKFALILKFIFQ